MQKNPTALVSIITPTYNSENYITRAISSTLEQTYSNFEHIIIDDCSTDNTWTILCEFSKKDSRIKILRNEKNLGASEARNNGIKIAKGNFIAFLDSDDAWLQNKLEKQIYFMLEKDILFCFSSFLIKREGI